MLKNPRVICRVSTIKGRQKKGNDPLLKTLPDIARKDDFAMVPSASEA
jgi:hypothetical protein